MRKKSKILAETFARWQIAPMHVRVAVCACVLVACGGDDAGTLDASIGADASRMGGGTTDSGTADGGGAGMCGEPRRRPLVYYGTSEPTALPLSVGQVQAIGTWGGCSGAFITPEWVLTANHCGVSEGDVFSIGTEPARPNISFRAVEVRHHPSQDMTLARMDALLTDRLPTAEPIPINDETLNLSRRGEIFEAAGYGSQEDGSSGEREFTAEPFDGLEDEFLVINGQGNRGVCFGDSGGPVMLLASDGSVRVAGDLSFGDPSCVGRDRYSRTDLAVAWIEGYVGPTIVDGSGCGSIDQVGRCLSGRALWCDGGELRSERCSDACGWEADASGYRCIVGPDPCDGLDGAGACEGTTARWCEDGVVRSRDCAACGQVCGDVGGLVDCQDDPCGGLDYLGRCDGDVAVWCDQGELRMQDCARRGGTCQYIDDRIGYFCTR